MKSEIVIVPGKLDYGVMKLGTTRWVSVHKTHKEAMTAIMKLLKKHPSTKYDIYKWRESDKAAFLID